MMSPALQKDFSQKGMRYICNFVQSHARAVTFSRQRRARP